MGVADVAVLQAQDTGTHRRGGHVELEWGGPRADAAHAAASHCPAAAPGCWRLPLPRRWRSALLLLWQDFLHFRVRAH